MFGILFELFNNVVLFNIFTFFKYYWKCKATYFLILTPPKYKQRVNCLFLFQEIQAKHRAGYLS